MYPTPLSFLGPLGGKRILICGIGVEAVAFALAGADVYGFDRSVTQVEAVKDLARSLALRGRISSPNREQWISWPIRTDSSTWRSERRFPRMVISKPGSESWCGC